jgi:anthranilate/para-aminobenzoate synthase component I
LLSSNIEVSVVLTVTPLDLPADATQIARRLWDREGVACVRVGSITYVACEPVEASERLDPEPTLSRGERPFGETPRWFGLLPYESLRHAEGQMESDARAEALVERPLWLRYDALVRVGEGVDLIAESEPASQRLAALLERPPRTGEVSLRFANELEAPRLHASRVRRALEEIASGNIYEVNLARRFELSVHGSAAELLGAFERAGVMPHSLALDYRGLRVVAVTPELCLRLEANGRVVTSPIKGTRPRHSDASEDARLARELDEDPKERAELTMIIDVERNDFGHVATLGSVRLREAPHVVSIPGVHHRVATVEAQIAPELEREELFRAVLPSGSVTGAPKRRAMELIRELEPHRRGLYTGAVGFVRHDGGVELKMAIRTLVARGATGHYFAGGGIVADSVPEREVDETLWKAERLLKLAAGIASP